MGNEKKKKKTTHTHTNTKTHIKFFFFFFKPSTLIRVIRKNKNPPKEMRGREIEYSHFRVGKIRIEWEK